MDNQKEKPSSSNPYHEARQVELEDRIKILSEKNQTLEKQNFELLLTLEENGLSGKEVSITEAEFICLRQLRMLRDSSEVRPLSKDEVMIMDLLHKNLLMARNIPISKKTKEKKKSVEELLKIVESGKK